MADRRDYNYKTDRICRRNREMQAVSNHGRRSCESEKMSFESEGLNSKTKTNIIELENSFQVKLSCKIRSYFL
jgi:hypothetical protein